MPSLKIAIIEDDPLIAESLAMALEALGYNTAGPAANFTEAQKIIRAEKPDFLLLDINLSGEKDGIDVAEWVNKEIKIPFIFLTGNTEAETLERAKAVRPETYLLKPFDEQSLHTAIEIAFSNFSTKPETQSDASVVKRNFVLLKKSETYHKVLVKNILFVETDNVYLSIQTTDNSFLIRSNLSQFEQTLEGISLIKTHRSYSININHLEAINAENVQVGGRLVPLQKNYRQNLLDSFHNFK
jgi:DNA-binding LytR/AlgR family response regulator